MGSLEEPQLALDPDEAEVEWQLEVWSEEVRPPFTAYLNYIRLHKDARTGNIHVRIPGLDDILASASTKMTESRSPTALEDRKAFQEHMIIKKRKGPQSTLWLELGKRLGTNSRHCRSSTCGKMIEKTCYMLVVWPGRLDNQFGRTTRSLPKLPNL